jgi:hypothetical protein
VKSNSTWLGVACNFTRSAGRIGATSPMPMKEITQAKATAQTALGCDLCFFRAAARPLHRAD